MLKKKPGQLTRYWSKKVFSGKDVPPKAVGDAASVKAWVAKTPNSLGYLKESDVDESVKVLFKVP